MADKISKFFIIFAILGALVASSSISWVAAQQPNRWTAVEQLSSIDTGASPGYIVTDAYGYVNVFWFEQSDDGRPKVEYSRFDGQSWSAPNDVMVLWADATPGFLAVAADASGNLHLLVNESTSKSIFYVHAPAYLAGSAKAWSKPFPLDILPFSAEMVVDSKGVIHIFYSDYYGEVPGVYYIRSTDGGTIWSSPHWLDPDIPLRNAPGIVQFALDDQDGLHALWYYVDLDESANPATWIRYSHSFDGGETWSTPFTIDKADESIDELRLPYPGLAVQGQSVQVIWAGDSNTHREHRYSEDRGQTWSETSRIMGDMVGQSLGDALVFDSLGRLHYAATLRYPQGIHYAVWDRGVWSIPSLIYLYALSSEDHLPGRVQAHNARFAIQGGNQLVLIFTNSPQDDQMHLFSMHLMLDDVAPMPTVPTPTTAPTLTITPDQGGSASQTTPTPNPTLVALAQVPGPSSNGFNPARGLFLGIIPPVLLIIGIAFFKAFRKR